MNGLRTYNIMKGDTISERKRKLCALLYKQNLASNKCIYVNKCTMGTV